MWKQVSQHNKFLCYDPQGFLNFVAQVGKAIIFTNFTWKLHLPLFSVSLTNIIIRFIIIVVILSFIIIIFPPLRLLLIFFFLFPPGCWLPVIPVLWITKEIMY
jgi:hypothetical protein